MAELRTVGIIGIAVGGTVLIFLLIVILCLVLRFRYNKWKISHPYKDPKSHSILFACYSSCCCIKERSKKQKQKVGLNPQISVSYQSEEISIGEDMQGVVIKNAEMYKESSFTNAAFVQSHKTNEGNGNSVNNVETRSAGIGKDMKIVITASDDEDFEVRRNIPIRRSADAYSEIDLRESGMNSQYLEDKREAKETTNRTKLKKARKWKGSKK